MAGCRVVFNINYASNRHVTYYNPATGLYYYSDDKLRQTVFGPGAFVQAYPIKFLFVQALGEQNFITQKLIYDNGSPTEKQAYPHRAFAGCRDTPAAAKGSATCITISP